MFSFRLDYLQVEHTGEKLQKTAEHRENKHNLLGLFAIWSAYINQKQWFSSEYLLERQTEQT